MFDLNLADRMSQILKEKGVSFEEKKMMGGLCFMVDDKMCCGIVKEKLMARVGPEFYEEALKKPHCSEMNFTGRPLKGFIYVNPEGIDHKKELKYWIEKCLEFNPKAKLE